MRRLILLVAVCLLSGCATRGTLDMDCTDFAATKIAPSQLVTDIQSGARTISTQPVEARAAALANPEALEAQGVDQDLESPMFKSMVRSTTLTVADGSEAHLLLSGGGQWGAYGAGFLANLEAHGKLPTFRTVTGVSTGALQSLFIGALGDPDIAGKSDARRAVFASLMTAYRPASEKQVVDRSSKVLSLITGSFAGLSPVRNSIVGVLCSEALHPTDCPLIARLARSDTRVFIGFVKASDGGFYYADINKLARAAYPDGRTPAAPAKLANAQRCIAGAALASLAMPVFFEQVRVGQKSANALATYYDGGVRQSVFEVEVARNVMRAALAAARNGDKSRIRTLSADEIEPLYVVRNGPTVMLDPLDGDPTFDQKQSIIDAALRAETILVNQLEVQSIADLRLADPQGKIFLRTADGFGKAHETPGDDVSLPNLPWFRAATAAETCVKQPKEAMFVPEFMACIMRYGRAHAEGVVGPGRPADPWMVLSPLDTGTK